MEEAARARAGARDAVRDIEPPGLRSVIERRIEDGSMIPGVLTVVSADVVTADGAVTPEAVDQRAAGVQLVYEGLRLTRSLVTDDPWADDPPADLPADVDVVAADVLVARGFRLLARTEAADDAVETVRAFGRRQTDRSAGRDSGTNTLEANVFELAVVAGASVAGEDPPRALRQYAAGLAANRDTPLPVADDGLPDPLADVLHRVSATPGE